MKWFVILDLMPERPRPVSCLYIFDSPKEALAEIAELIRKADCTAEEILLVEGKEYDFETKIEIVIGEVIS